MGVVDRTARIGATLLTGALGLALLGCGSSDDPAGKATTRTPDPQTAQYLARADAVCKEGRARFDPLLTRLTSIGKESTGNAVEDFAKADAVAAELVAVSETYLAQLVAMKPPADLAAPVAKWLGLQQQIVALLRRAKAAAGKRDSPGFKGAFVEINRVGQERNAAAVAVGFEVCGRT